MTKITFDKAIEIALEQHQAGHYGRAEGMYLEILQQDPGNVDAMHLLGVLAHQGQKPDVAVQLISRAISRRGDVAVFHYNLAEALHAVGRLKDAADSYNRAVELDPDYFEAYNNLGNAHNALHQYEEAVAACRRAIELDPKAAPPWNNLGNALRGLLRREEALEAYRKAIALRPAFAEAVNNMAMCLCNLGRAEEGLDQFREAIRLNPAQADLHNNLGVTLTFLNRHEEAGGSYQTALDLNPNHLEANNNLGATLRTLGKLDDALVYFRKALEIDPEFDSARSNVALTLSDQGKKEEALAVIDELLAKRPRLTGQLFQRASLLRELFRMDEGIACLRELLELEPNNVGAITALGYALLERGELDEAMAALKRSIDLEPDPQTHSNVLLTVNYHPGYTPRDLLDLHRTWARLHEDPHVSNHKPHANKRDPDRKLRIGYVSPDFRGHSVSFFLEPILSHHDHDRFEIYGYAQVPNPDHYTWRLRAQIDHWRDIAKRSPDEIADQIRADEIDILIELAGHTGGNSLPVFARKPAPVQINMIGFPSTTGLASIDYRVTDELSDPSGVSDPYNSEKLLRMPGVFWVYRPPDNSPEVACLPADENGGALTFTSVNNFTKVTPEVQHLWARVLMAVPGSRLILQTGALNSQHTRQMVTDRFAEHGVTADRLDFRVWSDMPGYLDLLNHSDLTLDPFPFNGGTTTCHSLWMGAPVITLAGNRHASRMGLSMMTAIGLPEFVAHTSEQYVEIAVRMASDLPRMREIRAGMRDRMKNSPLMDEEGYTKALEKAYRTAWRTWCESGL